jgi:hypothetical protein
MKKLFLTGSLMLFSAMTSHADSDANWSVTISSGMPPPPVVRHEPAPPSRPSSIWVQGYWGLNGNAYVWVPGRWERARPGYVYVQPQWHEGAGGWEFRQGGWREGSVYRDGPGHCPPGHRRKGEC